VWARFSIRAARRMPTCAVRGLKMRTCRTGPAPYSAGGVHAERDAGANREGGACAEDNDVFHLLGLTGKSPR
jgi:hypothetical protein